jgi:hypothetical protein
MRKRDIIKGKKEENQTGINKLINLIKYDILETAYSHNGAIRNRLIFHIKTF